MDLYLIRHADALALGERGITDDAERPLSEKGENQVHILSQGLPKKGITLDGIVTSPLVRSKQTAELLARSWSPAPPIHVTDTLLPNVRPGKLGRYLRKLGGQHIAVVGHLPQLPLFAAWLIGGKKAQLGLAKAGIACVNCGEAPSKGAGELQWLVTLDWFADGK